MAKTKIMFCYDTEDFTTVESTEAAAKMADILTEEGCKGSFMTVGRVAQELIKSKRFDLIDRLNRHEIDFHTKDHTVHPTLIEYTDIEDFNRAAGRLLKEECEGMGMVKAVFGNENFYAAVPPGPSRSYAAMIIYNELGIPVYADSVLPTKEGKDIFYCGALQLDYTVWFEGDIFDRYSGDDSIIDELKDRLATREKAIIYDHPNRFIFDEFWDAVNYNKENLCEYGKWTPCHRRSDEDIEKYFDLYRRLIRSIKNDSRFEITTPGEYWESIKDKQNRTVRKSDIPAIKAALEADFAPVSNPVSLSISEIFDAALNFLAGAEEYEVKRVYGFLKSPAGISENTVVKSSAIKEAASNILRPDEGPFFIPEEVRVGDKLLGAADFLFAMLETLCGKEDIVLTPRPQLNSLDDFPELRDLNYKGTWIYSDSLMDDYLSDRLRLQCWTLRY